MRLTCLGFPCDSDGATPEEQTKQILDIAPILPGQKPQRRFSIPEKSTTTTTTANDDLIDFGQNDHKNGSVPGSLVRKDSDAGSMDEFVDAES